MLDRVGEMMTFGSTDHKVIVRNLSPGEARTVIAQSLIDASPRPMLRAYAEASLTLANLDEAVYRTKDYVVVHTQLHRVEGVDLYRSITLIQNTTDPGPALPPDAPPDVLT